MKQIWVKVDPWNKELVTTALESGADAVVVPEGKTKEVKELGVITTVAPDGDLKWGVDVLAFEIRSGADEEEIAKLSRNAKVVVKTTDWTIIPLENLVAKAGNIWVEVSNLDEARTAMGILEKGVDGLILNQPDPRQLKTLMTELKGGRSIVDLVPVTVTNVKPLAMGDRVCVDTCSLMGPAEGMLVGNSSQGLFLVHAESLENPYVAPRPFRVNAGPVHSYILCPQGRTRYLSELKAGDEVMMVNAEGKMHPVVVGRVKVERRPLLLVEVTGPNGRLATILQNAETIRLVRPGGEAVSVVKLIPGDEILAMVSTSARHFGYEITETITEK
ncbi:MAG: 3-dehydroquinate synthase II [Deltaproteobacteria bacterium]|nr:3-dehydroquinate synthase II [Deltaproteobacteria bacterium]